MKKVKQIIVAEISDISHVMTGLREEIEEMQQKLDARKHSLARLEAEHKELNDFLATIDPGMSD